MLSQRFILWSAPEYSRSNDGSNDTEKIVREWLERLGVTTLVIESGSPLENGYIESFYGKLRPEHLNGEIFDTVIEARIITEQRNKHYNTVRSLSARGYLPLAPETYVLRQVANACQKNNTH